MLFQLKADYPPTGDQPQAIERLVASQTPTALKKQIGVSSKPCALRLRRAVWAALKRTRGTEQSDLSPTTDPTRSRS
jgi:hypothetical protein